MAAVAQEGGSVRFGEKALANEQVDEANGDGVFKRSRLFALVFRKVGFGGPIGRRGKLGEPALEQSGLLGRNLAEGDAHAKAGLRINNGARSVEGVLATIESDANIGADGQGNESVQKTAAPADVGGAGGHACAGRFLGDGGLGSKLMAKVKAAVDLFGGEASIRRGVSDGRL